MIDYADVDTLAAGYFQRGGQPGLAYGIVAGGEGVVGGEHGPLLAAGLRRGDVADGHPAAGAGSPVERLWRGPRSCRGHGYSSGL